MYLVKSQHAALKATLAAQAGYLDLQQALQVHNQRIEALMAQTSSAAKRRKLEACRIEDISALEDYITSKAFSPENVTWKYVNGQVAYVRRV